MLAQIVEHIISCLFSVIILLSRIKRVYKMQLNNAKKQKIMGRNSFDGSMTKQRPGRVASLSLGSLGLITLQIFFKESMVEIASPQHYITSSALV